MKRKEKIFLVSILAVTILAAYSIVAPFAVVPEKKYVSVSSVSECGEWSHIQIKDYYSGRYWYNTYNYNYDGVYKGQKVYYIRNPSYSISHRDERDGKEYSLKVEAQYELPGTVMRGMKYYCAIECLPANVVFGEPQIDSSGRGFVDVHINPGFEQELNRMQTRILYFDGVIWFDVSNRIDPSIEEQNVTIFWDIQEGMTGICKAQVKNSCGYVTDWVNSEEVTHTPPTPTPTATPTPTVTPTPDPSEEDEDNSIWVIMGIVAVLLISLIALRLRRGKW